MILPTTMAPHATDFYAGVPAEQVERLRRFRAAHPLRRAVVDGVEWEYVVSGSGEPPVLLLPGALGTAESAWFSIEAFEARHRVLAPTYPPVPTMAALADGLAGLLDHEGIGRAAVVGGSYGGFVAQAFVRRHPERVSRLVLSHTAPQDPARARKLVAALKLLRLFPEGLLRAMFRKRMAGLLPHGTPEAALFNAFFQETVARHVTKEGFLAAYRRVVDIDAGPPFTPSDLDAWGGPVLLVMADDDPATPEPVRARMREIYPQAEVHLLSGTGHAAAIVRPEEYYPVVERFLGTGVEALA